MARSRRAWRVFTLALIAGGWLAGGVTACGGGSDSGGTTQPAGPEGPDQAGTHFAGSIAVVSGDNQSVGAGSAVTQAPVLRVLSERARPLKGATLTLSADGGRGTLDATSLVTNDSGQATLPRWVAPLTSGAFAVSISAAGTSGTTVTTKVNATVSDAVQQLATQAIGPAGGTLTVSAPTSALNGLTITVPPGAVSATTTFTVSSRPAPAPPNGMTTAAPLIDITGPAAPSDSVMSIRLPGAPGSGSLRAFVVGPNNSLIAVATNTSDANSITIGVRAFSTPISGMTASASRALRAPGASAVMADMITIMVGSPGTELEFAL